MTLKSFLISYLALFMDKWDGMSAKAFDYSAIRCYIKPAKILLSGGMAEWFKAAVLKTAVSRGTVGSNPTPSATEDLKFHEVFGLFQATKPRRGEMAELAEGARLLSECGRKLPPRVRIPLSPPLQ
jgi:hypothetical protein